MTLKHALENKLIELNSVINTHHADLDHIGLFSGISGLALYQFYFSYYSRKDEDAEVAIDTLRNCIHTFNSRESLPTYCSGLAGMAWVFDHLKKEEFSDKGGDELFADWDELLFQRMELDLNARNIDFLHGGLGYLFYFIKRYELTENDKLRGRYSTYIFAALAILDQTSEKEENGVLKWLNTFQNKKGVHDLGISHGMAALVAILCQLAGSATHKAICMPLLEGAIKFMLSNRNKSVNKGFFPTSILNGKIEIEQSRVAWCYGDLGIGLVLLNASKIVGDDALQAEIIEMLKLTALRRSYEHSGVVDAGICHGAFGNAHLFFKIFKITNDLVFKETAEYWLTQGLNMAVFKTGYGGYKQWKGDDNEGVNNLSFLEGISGIALVILTYLMDEDLPWDECLLIR